jgi:hypothetical protein
MDKKMAEDFRVKSGAMVGEIEKLFKAGRPRSLAGMMTGSTNLILLKSRKVYRGPEAITVFWRELRARGIVEIRFAIKKSTPVPADALLPEVPGSGVYFAYDMANYLFGTYRLVSRTLPTIEGDFIILPMHQNGCPRKIMLMAFCGL